MFEDDHYYTSYYGSGAADYAHDDDLDEISDGHHNDHGDRFDILHDIDTVLFLRVNSFYHSISGHELDRRDFDMVHDSHHLAMNETGSQLANDERTQFAAGKINFFFH